VNEQLQRSVKVNKANAGRLLFAIVGLMAMAWACAAFPVFASENTILDVAGALIAGEVFKPEVLAAIDTRTNPESGSGFRAALLNRVVVIRQRRAEEAIRGRDAAVIDQRLESLSHTVDQTLSSAPDDAFVWFVKFWLASRRDGLRADNLAYLRMSYELGPYEGWISLKRNCDALAAFPALPEDLADKATAEFVGLVKWRLDSDAAAIAAGPGRPLRKALFSRLEPLSNDQRRAFADAIYGLELDDVPVPGVAPPVPPIPMPVLPPDF
jgi:hypothetical protein